MAEGVLHLLQRAPAWGVQMLMLCVWLALLAALFVPLERLWGQRPQRILRRGFAADLAFYFINGLLTKLLLVGALSITFSLWHRLVPIDFYRFTSELPTVVRLVAAMVVGDLGAYWGHRCMHRVPALWRVHAVHHSATAMDWLVNTRAHPLDLAFTRLCGLLPIYLLGLAQPAADSSDLVPLIYAIGGTVWGFFIHANLRWRFGMLEALISTPGFHHWHHDAAGPGAADKNFAAIFPWLDKIFGTFHAPRDAWPAVYGDDRGSLLTVVQHLWRPFARRETA